MLYELKFLKASVPCALEAICGPPSRLFVVALSSSHKGEIEDDPAVNRVYPVNMFLSPLTRFSPFDFHFSNVFAR